MLPSQLRAYLAVCTRCHEDPAGAPPARLAHCRLRPAAGTTCPLAATPGSVLRLEMCPYDLLIEAGIPCRFNAINAEVSGVGRRITVRSPAESQSIIDRRSWRGFNTTLIEAKQEAMGRAGRTNEDDWVR